MDPFWTPPEVVPGGPWPITCDPGRLDPQDPSRRGPNRVPKWVPKWDPWEDPKMVHFGPFLDRFRVPFGPGNHTPHVDLGSSRTPGGDRWVVFWSSISAPLYILSRARVIGNSIISHRSITVLTLLPYVFGGRSMGLRVQNDPFWDPFWSTSGGVLAIQTCVIGDNGSGPQRTGSGGVPK